MDRQATQLPKCEGELRLVCGTADHTLIAVEGKWS